MQEDEGQAPKTKSSIKNRDRNKNPLHGAQAQVLGEARTVSTKELRPNTWNYNTQSEPVFNKLVASMRRHGFVKRITTRQVPGKPGFEIVDGEHRWRAAQLLGITEVHIDDLGELPDNAAKELTILLNELGGRPDDVRLGDLLREINESVSLPELVAVMPFSASELDTYMGAMSFDLASLSGADTRPPESEEERDASPMKSSKKVVVVRWGGLQAYDVEKAIELAKASTGLASTEDAVFHALRFYLSSQAQVDTKKDAK